MANHQNEVYKFCRPIILFIDSCNCMVCEHQSKSNHVHHIDNDSSNNDPFNMIVLCGYHHKLVHKLRLECVVNFRGAQTEQRHELKCLLTLIFK